MDADDDGPILAELRDLQRRRQSGELTETQFQSAYRRLDSSVGRACTTCGHVPAVIRTGRQMLCGRCARG
jgi:hypothetical protein